MTFSILNRIELVETQLDSFLLSLYSLPESAKTRLA